MDRPRKHAPRLSLGTLLTALVFGAVLFAAATITAINYYFDTRAAERVAAEEFTAIAQRSAEAAGSLERRGEQLAIAVRREEAFNAPLEDGLHPIVRPLVEQLERSKGVFSLFVGYANGDYLEVSNPEVAAGVRAAWGARDDERWVVMQVSDLDGDRVEKRRFLDEALQVVRETHSPSQYYADLRPWFTEARPGQVRRTAPYVLTMVQERGISYTVGSPDGAVAGAIVLLSSLDALLDSSRFPQTHASMIFNTEGRIIASSARDRRFRGVTSAANIRDDTEVYPTLVALAGDPAGYGLLQRTHVGTADFYAWVQPLDSFSSQSTQEYIGLLGQRAEVMAPYRRQALVTLGLSLAAALLLLPLVFVSTRLVSRPIRALVEQSDKVRHRDYASVTRVPTVIREVSWLSSSLVNMAEAIGDYEQKQRDLHDAIVRLIAAAIDQKSPHTGGHCERVPALATLLAEAATEATEPPFADFALRSEEAWREFKIAAWLHDCGKITTPEHIVDKGAKLEALYNRIHEVRMRFEVLLRDAEIDYLRALREDPGAEAALHAELAEKQRQLREDFAFVAECNVGGEAMSNEAIERLHRIAGLSWLRTLDDRLGLSPLEALRLADFPSETPQWEPLLADRPEHRTPREDAESRFAGFGFTMKPPPLEQDLGELYNLSIRRGTLTDEDRYRINEHISSTIEMLETLPWPEELARVPEIAGGHHEKLDGTGYPRSLPAEKLSVAARIMAIADILEALTAPDRPYKKGKTLSESLRIMRFMALDRHIDADLFRLFIERGLHYRYAEAWMNPSQVDDVDAAALLDGLPESRAA
jgi:HD-GYP domain-containing protein (c-di-GMP phosphodiesterase class II)